ncbi:MAG: hypothetical protein K0R03_69 [Moraxellaceae bacterium]|jgi:hypothetical protein|nr:hypothetical protein [Moraxellaceae bacterium]
MTTYFAFRLRDRLQQDIDTLLANLDTRVSAPQHEAHTRISVELVDEILRNTVEELISRFQSGTEGQGVLATLLSLLKGTSHVLVRQLLGKSGNEDVARMAQYLRSRRINAGGQVLFGFAVEPGQVPAIQDVLAAVCRGEGEARKAELLRLLLSLSDQALVHFFDDFTAPMQLGFIKRKAADIGRATIGKGVHAAMNRLVPGLNQAELKVLADFLGSLLVTA